jgi:DNA-binding NtrC family response regulator
MTFPAPPLEGFVVVVQHRPDVARRLEAALAHAGATVFLATQAWEAIELRKKYDAQLVVFDSHDADGVANETVVVDARLMANVGAIRYSAEHANLPELMIFGTWIDIAYPVAHVVEAALEWRRLLNV